MPVIRFVARNFYSAAIRSEIRILELGSGTGANLWFCAREGFSVIALEGSETATEQMVQRFSSENLAHCIYDLKVGDYFNTLDKIDDDSVDAIIDVESLYCNPISRAREIVIKCFQKLKKGGRMMSITFAEGTWGMEGDECDFHAVLPQKGPMSGKGFSRYTTYDDIDVLYKLENNTIERIEKMEYHHSTNEIVKEWVVELRKN